MNLFLLDGQTGAGKSYSMVLYLFIRGEKIKTNIQRGE